MTPETADTLPLGARVVDRDGDDDGDAARVIRQREGTAAWVYVNGTDSTVAEFNPSYPTDAAVVAVAFEPALDDVLPDAWRSWTPRGLAAAAREADVKLYDYPAPRLRRVADE